MLSIEYQSIRAYLPQGCTNFHRSKGRCFMQRLKWSVISSVVLMGTLFASAHAEAQMTMTAGGVGVGPWWGGGGGGSYGGGTADGNYLSGLSQVIQSQGEYNLSTSKGLINYEDARAKY